MMQKFSLNIGHTHTTHTFRDSLDTFALRVSESDRSRKIFHLNLYRYVSSRHAGTKKKKRKEKH